MALYVSSPRTVAVPGTVRHLGRSQCPVRYARYGLHHASPWHGAAVCVSSVCDGPLTKLYAPFGVRVHTVCCGQPRRSGCGGWSLRYVIGPPSLVVSGGMRMGPGGARTAPPPGPRARARPSIRPSARPPIVTFTRPGGPFKRELCLRYTVAEHLRSASGLLQDTAGPATHVTGAVS